METESKVSNRTVENRAPKTDLKDVYLKQNTFNPISSVKYCPR
jgi:hypothetical protein